MLELFADNLCFFFIFLGFWADGAVLKPASPAAQTVHIKQLVSSRAPQYVGDGIYRPKLDKHFDTTPMPNQQITLQTPPIKIKCGMVCFAGASQ
jgi:hypothetical protein